MNLDEKSRIVDYLKAKIANCKNASDVDVTENKISYCLKYKMYGDIKVEVKVRKNGDVGTLKAQLKYNVAKDTNRKNIADEMCKDNDYINIVQEETDELIIQKAISFTDAAPGNESEYLAENLDKLLKVIDDHIDDFNHTTSDIRIQENPKTEITEEESKTESIPVVTETVDANAGSDISEKSDEINITMDDRMLDITPYDERLRGRSLNEPVPENFVVVDEMSMCGLQLFATMLGGIKSGSILLLVGDEDQLQSVEYGNILHDLINSGVIEVYRLREALRQSGTICTSAGKINQGICSLDYDDKFIVRNFSSDIDAVNAVKAATTLKSTILSPIKAYGDYGTRYLNKLLQGHSGDVLMSYGDVDYRLHDKIVMTDNNYTAGYVNGDIGEIIGIEDGCLIVSLGENRTLTIERDCMSDMDLAYALTIHKSQGSGFDDVHIILQSTSENMLSRRLLYTAVTRAKRKVTIYNVGSAINTAIINTKEYKRFSLLPLFLVQK
jgi:hypothetical protein